MNATIIAIAEQAHRQAWVVFHAANEHALLMRRELAGLKEYHGAAMRTALQAMVDDAEKVEQSARDAISSAASRVLELKTPRA